MYPTIISKKKKNNKSFLNTVKNANVQSYGSLFGSWFFNHVFFSKGDVASKSPQTSCLLDSNPSSYLLLHHSRPDVTLLTDALQLPPHYTVLALGCNVLTDSPRPCVQWHVRLSLVTSAVFNNIITPYKVVSYYWSNNNYRVKSFNHNWSRPDNWCGRHNCMSHSTWCHVLDSVRVLPSWSLK